MRELIERFGGAAARVLVIAAHPDDETIGAGACLYELSRRDMAVALVHATDGAPVNMADANAHGFETREAYAAARAAELDEALCLLPHRPQQFRLPFTDQGLAFRLASAAEALTDVLRQWRPTVVLTHPYEGGHPDHDGVAFITSIAVSACGLPERPQHFEFTSYHLRNGKLRSGAFLTEDPSATVCPLDVNCSRAKAEMLRCFVTQRETLDVVDPAAPECFRSAPAYDWRVPPHEPPLLYDLYDWGITSDQWRALAAAALTDIREAWCR